MMSYLPFIILQVVIFGVMVYFLRRVFSRNVTTAAAHLQSLSAEYTRRQEELKGKIFRMGHMGYVFERDIGMALYALKEVVRTKTAGNVKTGACAG